MTPNYDIQAARDKSKKSVKRYFEKHKACPDCNSTSINRNYRGDIMPIIGEDGEVANENSFKDENKATCKCGWTGIVHDLIPVGVY